MPLSLIALLVSGLILFTATQYLSGPALAAAGDGASSNIQLLDSNNNGRIDRITFDVANPNGETWSLNGASPYGLSVTQTGQPITITGVTFTTATNANPVGVQVDLDETDPDSVVDTDGVDTNAVELIYTQAGYGNTPNIQDSVDEELNAIASGDTGVTDTEIDRALPILSSVNKNTVAGFNRLTFSYTEDVILASGPASSASLGDITTAGTVAGFGSFGITGDVTVPTTSNTLNGSGGSTIHVYLADGPGGYINSPTSAEPGGVFTPVASAGIQDSNANQVNTNPSGPITTGDSSWDLIRPSLFQVMLYESFMINGRVDQARLFFTDNMRDSNFTNADGSLSGTGTFNTGLIPNDAVMYFDRTLDDLPINTSATAADFTYSGATTLITDRAGNLLNTSVLGAIASADAIEFDAVSPIILSARYLDSNSNTQVDQVEFTVSPDTGLVCTSFTGGVDFTIATPGEVGLTASPGDTCSTNGTTTFTINLATPGNPNTTGGPTTPQVNYIQPINGLEDGVGNDLQPVFAFATADGAPPVAYIASLNYTDPFATFSVAFSEPVAAFSVDQTKFHINNITGTDLVTLTQPTTSGDGKVHIFILTEAQRAAAIVVSGVLGGDGGAVVLDVDAGAVTETAPGTLSNLQNDNIFVAEIPDSKAPNLIQWDLNFNTNQAILTFDETMEDASLSASNNLMIQDAATRTIGMLSNGGTTASGNSMVIAIDLLPSYVNTIKASPAVGKTVANTWLTINPTLISDLSTLSVVSIPDGSALQANSVVGPTTLGTLTAPSVALSNTAQSASNTVTVNMTLANILPANGRIQVVFPAGFSVATASSISSQSGIDGTFTVSPAGSTVTISRNNDGTATPASTAISLGISSVVNPAIVGPTGTFSFVTQSSGGIDIDQDPAVPGVTITTAPPPPPPSGGGTGGGGGGGAPMPNPTSNTTTSSVAAKINTITGDQTYSGPVQMVAEALTLDTDSNLIFAMITENGTLLHKPNSQATISSFYTQNTKVTGPVTWDGRIDPPLIQSTSMISPDGDPIEGSTKLLKRTDVAMIAKIGSVPLEFSNDVTLNIPVDLPDGSVVDLYFSSAGNKWQTHGDGVVQNGHITLKVSHFSYFALVPTDETREVVAALEAAQQEGFTDIIGHWAEDFINRIYDLGVVSGKTPTTFAPNDRITRAELTKIAMKAFNYEINPSPGSSPFKDISVSEWYAPYIIAARDAGVVKGYENNTFNPNGLVNRAEALKIVLEAAGLGVASPESPFSDVEPSDWFAGYVTYASQNDIVDGRTATTFVPADSITRAEVAKIVVKILDLKGSSANEGEPEA